MLFYNIYHRYCQNKENQVACIKETIASLDISLSEVEQLLAQNGYIYQFNVSKIKTQLDQLSYDTKRKMSNPITGFKKIIYGLSSIQKQYEEKQEEFDTKANTFFESVRQHNKQFMNKAVADARKIVGNVEGRPLDAQQMECIVKNPRNQLVIAGAGTGKTTTIIGKVKFLLGSHLCKEDEICVLSFTNAAAAEMEQRLYVQTNAEIHVSTFHSLGLEILRQTDKAAPDLFNDLGRFVLESLKKHLEKREYAILFTTYLLFNRIEVKSEFDFKDEKSYKEYLETNPPMTILGESVKSYGEMEIANFLTQQGISYKYEAAYPIDTRTEEFDQYHPDFYLPDYNIYIEYFGINRKNEVPAYFKGKGNKTASQTYLEGMEWKRKLHRGNQTTLIECYAYEHMEGKMLDKLKQDLLKFKVKLTPINVEDVFQYLSEGRNRILEEIGGIMQTVISLAKGKRMTSEDLLRLCEQRCIRQIPLAHLVVPIMEDYESYLRSQGQIDFTDMLNRAGDYINEGKYHHKYKYVIVDEYQDLSSGQYELLKALRKDKDYTLFCVGDDWQSIYRFNGSDISYILHFSEYWGDTETSYIETTYRFFQRLVDISGDFIMKNPNQLRKRIRSGNDAGRKEYVLGKVEGYTERNAVQFMREKIIDLPQGSSVYFIGRYKFDVDIFKNDIRFKTMYDNSRQATVIRLEGREDLKMEFYTAHKSKGLQADYVFIINNKAQGMGFPSKIKNSTLIEQLLERSDDYPYAEERRLFYVALTRARKQVFLVIIKENISVFANEMINKYQDEMKKLDYICPRCGAPLKRREGQYGPFLACSAYSKGCTYTRKIRSKSK